MRTLLGVELTRLRWRRAVMMLLLLAVVVPAVIFAARVWTTRPVTPSEIAAVEQAQAAQIAECVDHPRRFEVDGQAAEEACADRIVGWYTGRETLALATERTGGSGMAVVAILTAALLLAGATFVGHDWNTGSMSNQLLFEPRRARVWTAKALAVTLVSLALAAAVSTAYWLGIWGVLQARDLPVADGSLGDSLAFGLRGAGFAAAAALGGFALTTLCRSTVATIGVLFAVSVAGGLFVAMLGLSGHWQPQKNVAAIVKHGTTYYVDPPDVCFTRRMERRLPEDGAMCDPTRELTMWSGIGYYGVALVGSAGASVLSFRRRDVA